MSDPVTRYYNGARPSDFSPAEARALAEELMARPEYSDPKSRQHQELSKDVQALWAHASPGHLGAGGEVVGGSPQIDRESLFR
jgi:hypothetical protein